MAEDGQAPAPVISPGLCAHASFESTRVRIPLLKQPGMSADGADGTSELRV